MTHWTSGRLVLASAGLCVLASAFLLFAPIGVASQAGSGTTITGESDGGGVGESDVQTAETLPLVREITTAHLVFFGVPVVVASAPFLVRRRKPAVVACGISAGLLFLWVLFLASAGGIFYIPSAGLMVAAAVHAGSDTSQPAGSGNGWSGPGSSQE